MATEVPTARAVPSPGVTVVGGGEPTPEELAAIVAAVSMSWARPAVEGLATPAARWRFSGRWWSKPVPSRRDRP